MPLLAPVRVAFLHAGRCLSRIGSAAILLALGACHDTQHASAPAATYTLGGAISGLTTDGLVIANGNDTVTVAANSTTFTLPTRLTAGASYVLTVQTQPSGLTCSFSSGTNVAASSGTMPGANLTSTAVACAPDSYALGGTVSGLSSGTLVLENGGQTVSVTANSSFQFADAVAYSATYSVQVQSNPVGQACTVSSGTGTMPAGAVSNVTVTCASTSHTIGGTISGLTTDGLVLLNNGGDATTLNSGATSFVMPTAVADGAAYAITVGTQPYGVNLACTPANSTGTVSADVTNVTITCATTTPTQTQIASVTSEGIAVDSHGNLFLSNASTVWEIPYSNGSYGPAVDFLPPNNSISAYGIATDSHDNIFISDINNDVVIEYFSSTGYTTSVNLPNGAFIAPYGLAIDSNDNLLVADAGDGNPLSLSGAVWKYTYNGASYDSPVIIISGLNSVTGVAADSSGNIFVVDVGSATVTEWPANTYSMGTTLPFSGLRWPWGIAVDKYNNVFVTDAFLTPSQNQTVKELPYDAGSYGTQITIGSGLTSGYGIAVNSSGRLIVSDLNNSISRTFLFTP